MSIKKIIYTFKNDILSLTSYPISRLDNYSASYDYYWSKKRQTSEPVLSTWQKMRMDHVIKMIEPGSSVLDFGCGDGAVLKYLADKKGIKGIGVDVSEDILARAKKLGIETIKLDISKLDELDSLPAVDYITGFEIIEHIPNPEEFISRIKNKAGKALIFSVPNSGYYIHRLRFLFGRFPLQWVSHPGEHLRFWTVKDIKWWIKTIGFKLDEMVVYGDLGLLKDIFPKIFGRGIIIKISR
ncbi:MAG: methionine biosynthesis protein MetW [Candidatus Buchananbacteria bacterium]|nr:methionine biosynthesis protein MetW [Candidatus Buchananbacteria bacterium]